MSTPSLSLSDRVAGCWLGKSIGGTLGLPAEGKPGPLNFSFYDPVPTSAPPNDDLELQLVWLDLLEKRGFALTQRDLAEGWLAHIHYMWDEYGRCRWNLRRGVPPAAAGVFENWFVSGMGSPIRSEIWACLCAGRPEHAAAYATLDASLDHGAEGIAGEVFLAVMQSLVLDGVALREACERGLAAIDSSTETARALGLAFRLHREGLPEWDAYRELVAKHGHDNFTHAPLNLGLIGWALAYGDGDFDRSLLLGTNCGYDTDCTAATVGATLGMLLGAARIPSRWKEPIGDAVWIGPGIQGIDAPKTLADLTARTLALAERFAAKPPETPVRVDPAPPLSSAALPGTILLEPLDGSTPVAWANGELPGSVLAAGGAEWTWTVGAETRSGVLLVALAREGCRLLIDGAPVIDCPAGVPFVPAVHRPASESCAGFTPTKPTHRVRLELRSRSTGQDASVIIATPNKHLTTWSGEVLPHAARL
jgi:ADP-ribosylglycohydrolase